ncbi:MAG: putative endonuclease [Arenicella sp.]|jgi:putative endonuclease
MTCFVYILRSTKNGRYYIGQTQDISKRVLLHNKGKVKSTKPYSPWELIFSEEFGTRGEAILRESQIKSWKSRKRIEALINELVP